MILTDIVRIKVNKKNQLMLELFQELNNLVPEITNYINQFHSLVTESNINVVTDAHGNLSLDAPSNVSDEHCEYVSKKVGILDRIINTKFDEADKLIEQGNAMEKEIKSSNKNSQIQTKLSELKELKNRYGHFVVRQD
mgnify:FL=1